MPRSKRKPVEKAKEVVDELQRRYPHLTIRRDAPSQVDLNWTIPAQPGIKHVILIYVSHGELCFDVGGFHMTYFPCDEEKPRAQFMDAVTGFIDGRYRVREHYRRGMCITAELETLEHGEWRTVASRACLHWPFPRKKEFKFLQNVGQH